MGDGTHENPLTREDVLRLIEENEGKAKGLDLSGKVFKEGIDLSGLNLEGINLRNGLFVGATLRKTNLSSSQLQGVNFIISDLQGANLEYSNLEDAQLLGTILCEADLNLVEFTYVKLADINWGNYVLGEEKEGNYYSAEETYRRLKMWYTEHGIYNTAGKFFYREVEAKRKAQSWKKEPHLKMWSWVMRMLCGYGEKPERVVISAAVVIFGLAAAYYFWGSFGSSSFWDTLYYSAASFTALGYGSWAPQPVGWAKAMGATEALIGVFTIALFLVTFIRKMTR